MGELKKSYRMKVFQKGQVVIPVKLREKYRIAIGDQVEVVPKREGILLRTAPKQDRSQKRTDVLFGIFKEHSGRQQELSKKAIAEATETSFVEGWKK